MMYVALTASFSKTIYLIFKISGNLVKAI